MNVLKIKLINILMLISLNYFKKADIIIFTVNVNDDN